MEWVITLLMTEGHQPLPALMSMDLGDLLMWGSAVQAMVNAKNELLAKSAEGGK